MMMMRAVDLVQSWRKEKQAEKVFVCEAEKSPSVRWLASGRFRHDEDFDRLAERDGSLYGCLWRREAVDAVAPSQLGGRRGGGEGGGGGAVGQQEAHLNLRRL